MTKRNLTRGSKNCATSRRIKLQQSNAFFSLASELSGESRFCLAAQNCDLELLDHHWVFRAYLNRIGTCIDLATAEVWRNDVPELRSQGR